MVRNLLSNALKFTGNDGSIQVTVTRYRELANIDINKNRDKSRMNTSEEGGSFKDNTLGFLRQASAMVRKSFDSSFELFKYNSITKITPKNNNNNNNNNNGIAPQGRDDTGLVSPYHAMMSLTFPHITPYIIA